MMNIPPMEISFISIKEKITQTQNIIFESVIEVLNKETVHQFLTNIEEKLIKNDAGSVTRRKTINILLILLQVISRVEDSNNPPSYFKCLFADYNWQLAIMVSFTIPISYLEEWQTILNSEYDRESRRTFYQKHIHDTSRLDLFDLKWRYGKHIFVDEVSNSSGLLEIVFLLK